VGIYDYGTQDGEPYLVMDFVEGESLSSFIQKCGTVPENEAIEIASQICDGMEFAHHKGVIHRDLKPSNVMVSRAADGTLSVRILDFGVAKLTEKSEDVGNITQTGELVGSPLYMSPEQCLGHHLDRRSDIYSLGCIMFEMLTGRRVFTADSPMAIMVQHMNDRPPLFRSFPDIPKVRPELERIVMQTLEKEQENRYQSAGDLQKDLALVRSGKNPIKEFSRSRKRFEVAASSVKFAVAGILGAVIGLGTIQAWDWYSETSKPQWMKTFATARNNFALSHNQEEAEIDYLRALKQAREAGANGHQQAEIFVQLSRLFLDIKDAERALPNAEQALALSETGDADALRADIFDQLTQGYLLSKQYEKAADAAGNAVKIRRKVDPNARLAIANSLKRLGDAYRQMNELPKAEAVYRESITLYNAIKPLPARELGDADQWFSYVLFKEKKYGEALTSAQEAMKISVAMRGTDHPSTVKLGNLLTLILLEKSGTRKAGSFTVWPSNEPGKNE
jgi:hypothetical protein